MLYRPNFAIFTPSRDITRSLNERVTSVDVIEYAGMQSDELILVLDDHPDYRLELPKVGDKIRVELGYLKVEGSGDRAQEEPIHTDHGEYEVAEYSVSGSRDTLTIYANKLMFANEFKAPRQFSWLSTPEEPLMLETVLSDIAARHGLESRANPQLAQIQLPQIDQSESDMQLLTRLAGIYDATVKVVENFLLFMPRNNGRSRTGQDLPVETLPRQQLISWEMLASGLPAYESCTAYYYDWLTAERKSVSAGSGSPNYTINHTLPDENTATLAATARLNDFKRTQHSITGSAIGKAELFAGGVVQITDVRAAGKSSSGGEQSLAVDGNWCLTKVHHRIDSSGYVSHFEGEKVTE